jgi:type II secretory pathway component PulF
MILTPGQIARRADFYYQLNQLTAAGLGVVAALQQLQRSPPAASYRKPLQQALAEIGRGASLTEAFTRTAGWVPALDIALVGAAEKSGRLDQGFRLLAQLYSERAQLIKRLIADLAYPVFLLHFAILIFPFPNLFLTGNWLHYLRQVLTPLLPIYAATGLLIYALQRQHGERWRARVEGMVRMLPVIGTAQRYLALARLSAALEALLSAGVMITDAWELAAAASGSALLSRTVLAWREPVNAGQTPAELVAASGRFPALFSSQYSAGEVSGSLEATMGRLHRYFQEEGSRKLQMVAKWVPMAVYVSIMIAIAYKVISFYLHYFQEIRNAGGF